MDEDHPHVDLEVLALVEGMLTRREPSGPSRSVDDVAPPVRLRVVEPTAREHSATHPAAHVPELPVIAKEPVTPPSRRR